MGAGSKTDTREYPTKADDYELLEECGQGVSGKVWRALCKPHNSIVAVKLLDLESMSCNLEEIIREAHIMKLVSHENILSLHCSFVHQEQLWMVMPYVKGGSVLNIMKYAFPKGLDEPLIATILKEVLRALDYVHRQGHIHRDVKAGNILIGSHGEVKLADFGVAATMDRGGSTGNSKRQTFVGTPCWMAPEVMEQTHGYDAKADIWSFGITILELAHGSAPFAKFPPMKVLMMTLQQPPPQLQQTGEKHFSKEIQQLVGLCLVKDPSKRPSAARLLEHRFFRAAHDSAYLVRNLLAELPPLTERMKQMRANKGPGGLIEKRQAIEKSNEEYIKGVSAWNFDVQDLKQQAALEPADDDWNFDQPSQGNAADAAGDTSAPAAAEGEDGKAQGSAVMSLEVPFDSVSGASGQGPYSPSSKEQEVSGPAAITPGHKPPREGERKGRFQIVQADANLPQFESPSSSLELPPGNFLEQHAKSRQAEKESPANLTAGTSPLQRTSSGNVQEPEQPKKKPSRFNIVSEDSGLPPKPGHSSNIQRSGSAAAIGESGLQQRGGGHRLDAALPHLEAMVKLHQKQAEELQSIVSAMASASQGKPEALQRLTSQSPSVHLERLLPTDSNQVASYRKQIDRLTSRVKELEEEKARLRHDYDKLRQKLERSQQALLAD